MNSHVERVEQYFPNSAVTPHNNFDISHTAGYKMVSKPENSEQNTRSVFLLHYWKRLRLFR